MGSNSEARMKNLNRQEQSAIEAVAGRFSATREKRGDSPGAYLTVTGKPIAVDVTTLKRQRTVRDNAAKPALRFDKVVIRLMERLQATLGETVPDGVTVLLTVTAPIRMPSKTAAALEDRIQALLRQGPPARDERDTVYGNGVRIRFLRDKSGRAPKLIGFVHNSDSDPLLLFNMTGELLELVSRTTGRRAARLRGDRWLVAISAGGSSRLEAYRYIYSQLQPASGYTKVLMVFGDGRVGMLTG